MVRDRGAGCFRPGGLRLSARREHPEPLTMLDDLHIAAAVERLAISREPERAIE